MKVLIKMPKTFLKIICASFIGFGALIGSVPQSFSQSQGKLEDPGYGIHMQGVVKDKGGKQSESGLTFTTKELNRWRVRQKKLVEDYERTVMDLFGGRYNAAAVVPSLRIHYPRTPYYDPIGKYTIARMTEFAYKADMSSDQSVINEALAEYRDLLRKHIVNLDVLEYALTLARANPIYGNQIRLQEIHKVLLRDIEGKEKKGKSPDDAYRIVTYGEETYLLAKFEVTVQKSEIYKVENSFYNVHDVVDKDGKFDQLYFDVTWPIYLFEKNKATKESEERFSIPLQ
jgi:hypothetical protein